MLFLITTPPNSLEKKGRVLGNYSARWNRLERQELRGLCTTLRDKGVSTVYVSDLDADAGNIVGDELHATVVKEHGLRRLNAGRHHGTKLDHFHGVLEHIIPKWRTNPSIPVRGGDSWTSLEKRLFKAFDKIAATSHSIPVSSPES